ncbi:NAD(P)H-binding protein [Streptomyces sp. NPDC058655]|uniref:NAD(P)H-binding protein n=1 Tax=unclassified Streptomyces TaxID=2593676 RepID=UPI003656A6ED
MRPWPQAGPRTVVTGATGAVGRHVARGLAAAGGHPDGVRLLVRDLDKAARTGLPGRPVDCDHDDRAGLERALAGADSVLVVTANPLRPQHDENILAAARAGGVRRAVKLSWLAVTDPGADDLITRWNRDCEALLRASMPQWTVLRMRSLMSNTLSWAASIREESVVRALGGDAPTASVDPRDVAAAAIRALTGPGHAGRAYAVTGPGPITAREQTAQLARVLGKPLGYEELTPDQALGLWRARFPEPVARALLEGAERRAAGGAAGVEGDLEAVTGRAPRPFASWAADHTDHFR